MRAFVFINIIVLLFFAAGGCKKIDVEPEEGTPVFVADFAVDGVPVSLSGGVDDFYMFTSFEQDANNIYSFIGKLNTDSANVDALTSLEIRFRDFQQVPPNFLNIDSSFLLGEKLFLRPTQNNDTILQTVVVGTDYKVSLFADSLFSPPTSSSFLWNIADSIELQGNSTSVVFDTLMPSPFVTLTRVGFEFGDSCITSQTQYLQQSTQDRCGIYIRPVILSGELNDLEVVPSGNFSNGWTWNNASLDTLLEDSTFTIEPEYTATVETLPGDCEASASFYKSNNLTGSFAASCYSRYEYEVEEIDQTETLIISVPGDSLHLGTVSIIYTDESGEEYRSDLEGQPNNSTFSIIDVQDYDLNENGFPTKILTLRFSCLVWNADGESRVIESISDVTFGVAYPN